MGEERPWEKSYPAGVRWDAPIEMAPLPPLFDAFTESGTQAHPKSLRTFLGDKLGRHELPRIWNSATPCRRPPSASCRRKN